MKCFLAIAVFLVPLITSPQQSAQVVEKPELRYAFGQIFTDFRVALKPDYKPPAAFSFNQGIIGYHHGLNEKLSGTIMFDVTRTTNFYSITDSAGHPVNYEYFEGSKYTAYLKMAEIRWMISPLFTFRVGQLLNTQYLTFQDKFWGYRYVDVTYQEKFRLGMPADFGAQVDFTWKNKFVNQFSVVNGEGPFRYQDQNGKFLVSNNFQYYPTEQLTLKLYTDYGPSPDTGSDDGPKSVISGFAGYKTNRWRLGAEYTYVFHYGYLSATDFYGFSVYSGVVLNRLFQVFGRWDHLDLKSTDNLQTTNYYILGFQYEPLVPLQIALNFRYYSPDELPLLYVSFGIKF